MFRPAEYEPEGARPIRVDPLVLWAVSGFAGVVRILRQQVEGGVELPHQVVTDIGLIQLQLDYIVERSTDATAIRPPLGGASGALARHLE